MPGKVEIFYRVGRAMSGDLFFCFFFHGDLVTCKKTVKKFIVFEKYTIFN